MKKIKQTILMLVVVGFVAKGAHAIFGDSQSDEQHTISQFNAKVVSELKDPSSAQVLSSRVIDHITANLSGQLNTNWIIQTNVRAKNSFGAYVVNSFCGSIMTRPGDHKHIMNGGKVDVFPCEANVDPRQIDVIKMNYSWDLL